MNQYINKMSLEQDKNKYLLKELLGRPGNGSCADCGAAGTVWSQKLILGLPLVGWKGFSTGVRQCRLSFAAEKNHLLSTELPKLL